MVANWAGYSDFPEELGDEPESVFVDDGVTEYGWDYVIGAPDHVEAKHEVEALEGSPVSAQGYEVLVDPVLEVVEQVAKVGSLGGLELVGVGEQHHREQDEPSQYKEDCKNNHGQESQDVFGQEC